MNEFVIPTDGATVQRIGWGSQFGGGNVWVVPGMWNIRLQYQ